LDPILLRCVCKEDLFNGRFHNDRTDDDDEDWDRKCIDPCRRRKRCRILRPGWWKISHCYWDGCCWQCPRNYYQDDDRDDHDHDHDHDRNKRDLDEPLNYEAFTSIVFFLSFSFCSKTFAFYLTLLGQCPYRWGPLADGSFIDRREVSRCLV
jgi:hypothetical protein